jgi:calcium-translocating P-type ATPase
MLTSPQPRPTTPPVHAQCVEDALAALASSPDGLSSTEAATRLARHGPNRLPEAPRQGIFARIAAQVHNVLIYVLLAAAAVTALLGHGIDTAVILAVVVLNTIIGLVQEGRAEAAMSAIRGLLAPRAAVLRDGRRISVPGADLVPGDIVLIEAGDRVPADLRLIDGRGLAADEAMLTGESVPAGKSLDPVPAGAPLGDRASMLWSGTLVTQGAGRGVVAATGTATEIGRIGGLLAGVQTLTTPLVAQMDRFARWLSLFILLAAALLLAFGLGLNRLPFEEMFMAVVAVAVSAIPEGLPAVLTITLAIGVQAMARRHAIVRRLPAIETVGAVSVICTDKTGTLTRNEMTVARVEALGVSARITGDGYAPEGRVDPPADLADAALVAALCNDAALRRTDTGWTVEGDPMEGALLAFAARAGADAQGWARTDAIPFDSRHRYMAVAVERDGVRRILVKGAPERVLMMCGGEGFDLSHWHAVADTLAAGGHRVLALAGATGGDLAPETLEGGLTLHALVGLIDPPRPEAVAAVADCRAAGIAVKMITGDHAGTAAAIAAQVGLEHPGRVLTGAELDGMDDARLAATVRDVDVFARTSPEHKLRLVTALQAHGLTVAMTGDGVNDAPALKRADVGIAMGGKGSEAAREAADLVLTDDNFASIAAAVREGRTVWDNIRKVIGWTLPTNAGESSTIILALLLGLALPISALQVLWVNMITSVTLGLALAFEPTEPGTMRRPPRSRQTPLLSGALIWHVALVGTLFAAAIFGMHAWALSRGHAPEVAQALAVNTLVILKIFHLFFIRNLHSTSLRWDAARGTRAVWLSLVVAVAAQLVFTYWPPAQEVFGTGNVPLLEGAVAVALGVVFFALIEAEKQVRLSLRPESP